MSINKYNATTGSLEAISQGRVWVGTKAEWEATVASGSYPKNVLVAITDDEQGPVDVVEKDNENAVQSGAVYDAVSKTCSAVTTSGTLISGTAARITAPADGYITVLCISVNPAHYALINLYNSSNQGIGQSGCTVACSSGAYGRACLFVRKGQHLGLLSQGANGTYEFTACDTYA